MNTHDNIRLAEEFGAHNYHPLPVVLQKGEGVWVTDVEGKKYIDMLSSYSALNFGHRHPALVSALKNQLDRIAVTSRAFFNDQYGPFCQELAQFCSMEWVLPMNSGAEAVETAIKTARKWGYQVKGIAKDKAEIICFSENFHGRTTTIVGFSTDSSSYDGFGPFAPGFHIAKYGDIHSLKNLLNRNTAAVLIEPIQGEAGIIMPPAGYLKQVEQLCRENNVLLLMDEIQTGFGRTGKKFACEYENVKPNMFILGKALGGGLLPVSAVASTQAILKVLTPGTHGSTFGGMPLSCAVARQAIKTLQEEHLTERAAEMGTYFMGKLKEMNSSKVKDIRGRGLLIGVELHTSAGLARPLCEKLMTEGLLCKDTHEQTIRFAPPLTIRKEEIDWAMERIRKVIT